MYQHFGVKPRVFPKPKYLGKISDPLVKKKHLQKKNCNDNIMSVIKFYNKTFVTAGIRKRIALN